MPASGGIQPGSIGRWRRVPRERDRRLAPGLDLDLERALASGPKGNGSSTSTRTANSTLASGATTDRGGWTSSLRRAVRVLGRDGHVGRRVAAVDDDDLVPADARCLATSRARCRPRRVVNGVTEIRPSSTVEPAGSAAGRTRIPNG